MQPFTTFTGQAIPFGAENIDTDVIIPARFLKTISRTGLGRHAFTVIRANPDNVFDSHAGAPILIAGDNFGCGSSREHAPWALADMGIKVVIAPSFADIFSGNAFKNAMVLVVLPQDAIDRLMDLAMEGQPITIDLENQIVTTPYQDRFAFPMDPFRKHCLMNGLDEIGLTIAMDADIALHEARLVAQRPWIAGAATAGAAG
ncbi:3-isopropylmalate dehydratase small subunit [Sandarakinorhabdus sp.]|uniref:3-isopropylmalate dehydratase small subunit n=1 Tax=Sandarakinorhabdus sp. TaxID=1916663 RepID=UPI00286DC8FE|nr:3-isopropylmalate dehydratase small subunit [Sandarakinorhabdus sp.]